LGIPGVGSTGHVTGLFFQKETGARFQHVPYRGNGPAMQDLVAGQIDLLIEPASNFLPQVRAGALKAYAVTAKTRMAAAPTFQPSTRPGCRASTRRSGTGCGCPRTRRRISSRNSTPRLSMP
jgi:tripartite-type tricarboxylate transporter receptor subunit TctC